MALRDDLLPVFGDARALVEGFGLRTSGLSVQVSRWPGVPGDGRPAVTVLAISPSPKIRTVNMREIASSGGRYLDGDVRVTKITPSYAGGGYTEAQLRPVANERTEVVYVVTGAMAGDYVLVDSDFSRNFGYELTLRRKPQ